MKCGHPVAVIRLRWSAVIHWLPEGRMSFVGRIAWSTTKVPDPINTLDRSKIGAFVGRQQPCQIETDIRCQNCGAKEYHNTLFRRFHSLYNAAPQAHTVSPLHKPVLLEALALAAWRLCSGCSP